MFVLGCFFWGGGLQNLRKSATNATYRRQITFAMQVAVVVIEKVDDKTVLPSDFTFKKNGHDVCSGCNIISRVSF